MKTVKRKKHQDKDNRYASDLVKSTIVESDLDDFIKLILKEMLEHYRRDIEWRYVCHIPVKDSVLSLFCDNESGLLIAEVVDAHKFEIQKTKTMSSAKFQEFVILIENLSS